jgi:dTDP-4-amino-4,6-dideoxygalactose transaminase
VVLLPRDVDRSAVITLMRAADVETTIGTYHVPMTRFFRERRGSMVGEFPITDDVADRALSLPLFAGITVGQQEQVVDSLLRAIADRPV